MVRLVWLVALIAACDAGRHTEPVAPVAVAPARVAADAAPVPTDAAPADPPEPTQPQLECAFQRRVQCQRGTPTRTALQQSPFEWCPSELPVARKPFYGGDTLRFSAAETRNARRLDHDACCYVEFVATACD
ncbi:MAG TPA: hypothetical protein VLX92_07305 [Kofleriaceae bacterium]|nr:hypothetical protein [Kofleriaceae bacterium]